MNWCTIDKNYIDYLKKFDDRIPNVEYGKYKFKPFFKPLFTKDNLTYVTQISSKKERHLKLKEQIDFIKYKERIYEKIFNKKIKISKFDNYEMREECGQFLGLVRSI